MWMGVFMLAGEMALEICLLAKRGKGLRAIAREIGVSRNTVRRYLRDGDADRYRPRPRRSGKLVAPLDASPPQPNLNRRWTRYSVSQRANQFQII